MTPLGFDTANAVLTVKGGIDLPVHRDEKTNTYTSLWHLSDEDMMNLANNRFLLLTIHGKVHPPIQMQTIDRPKNEIQITYPPDQPKPDTG